MGKSAPAAPQAPDPWTTAAAQQWLYNNTFNDVTAANRYNVATPYGDQTWTRTPLDSGNAGGANSVNAMSNPSNSTGEEQSESGYGSTPKTRQDAQNSIASDPQYTWTQTQTLNPADQAIIDQQRAISNQKNVVGQTLLGRAQDTLATPLTQQTGVDAGPLQNAVSAPGRLQYGIDTQNVPGLVGGNALLAQQGNVNNALYKQAVSRLDPQWANAQNDLQSRLANEGITIASNPDAYNRAITEFNNAKNDAYNQANYSAIGQGVNAGNTLYNQGLQSNQQLFNENAAQAQMNNAAVGQGFGQNLQAGQFANAAQNQAFGQGVTNANLYNQATQTMYNSPLNALAALQGGQQIQQGNFGPSYQGNMGTPDYQGAVNQAYQGQLNAYDQQTGTYNDFLKGLFGLGSAAIGRAGATGG